MQHNYYLIEVNQALTDNEYDEDGNIVVEGQKRLIKRALKSLGRQSGMAYRKTHLRASTNHQKVIIEMETPVQATKAQFCNKMSELLPWSAETISNKTTITKMTNAEAKLEISNNKADWGEEW